MSGPYMRPAIDREVPGPLARSYNNHGPKRQDVVDPSGHGAVAVLQELAVEIRLLGSTLPAGYPQQE
jgi:hypothetical protein